MKAVYFCVLLLTSQFFVGIQTSYSTVKKNIADEIQVSKSFFSNIWDNHRHWRNVEYGRARCFNCNFVDLSSKKVEIYMLVIIKFLLLRSLL